MKKWMKDSSEMMCSNMFEDHLVNTIIVYM